MTKSVIQSKSNHAPCRVATTDCRNAVRARQPRAVGVARVK